MKKNSAIEIYRDDFLKGETYNYYLDSLRFTQQDTWITTDEWINFAEVIDLYIQYDMLDAETIYTKFIEFMEHKYNKEFSKKSCLVSLLVVEIEKILNKEEFYYQGFSRIEEILRTYNLSLKDDCIIDSYGENIDKELADMMHDFDLESSLSFSQYEDENYVIENINNRYNHSSIDETLKIVLSNLKAIEVDARIQ